MAAPTPDDLAAFMGEEIEVFEDQAEIILGVVTQMAKAYTRDQGFSASGVPNPDLQSVILCAAARLISHPRQNPMGETLGPQSANYGAGFTGWSIPELFTLNRYRARAQ